MPKFVIRDRQASWVTFKTIIEAESEEEAYALWQQGDLGSGDIGPEIGDCISEWPGSTDVFPFPAADLSQDRQRIRADLAVEACALLVAAYRRGLGDGAKVEWEDLDAASSLAAEAIGVDLNEPLEETGDDAPSSGGEQT